MRVVLGKETLLGMPEVCQMTGLCPVTASKLMKETGKCLQLHRRMGRERERSTASRHRNAST